MKYFVFVFLLGFSSLSQANTPFVCEEGADCPHSIALISNHSTKNESVCLGTIIEKNKILTSTSCLKNIQASFDCKNININFLELSDLSQRKCNEIEKISYSDYDLDFAILKLDIEVNLKLPSINTGKSLSQDEIYTTWSLVQEEKQITLKQESCKPVYNSYANPTVKNGTYTNTPFYGCNLSSLSSGSPLMINNKLYGVFSKKINQSLVNELHNNLLIESRHIDVSFMTNIACANIRGVSPTFKCKNGSKNIKSERADLVDVEQYDFSELLNEAQITGEKVSAKFKFSYSKESQAKNGAIRKFTPSKICFKKNIEWISEYARFGGRLREYGSFYMTLPDYSYGIKLDSKLNSYKYENVNREKDVEIIFRPRQIKYMNETPVHVKGVIDGSLKYAEVKECK